LVALALPLLLIWGTTAYYVYYQAYGLITPGVHALGLDLGGLPVSRAAAKLDRAWNVDRKIEMGRITSDGVQSWLVAPPEVGIRVDALATAQAAYRVGRERGALSGLARVVSGLWLRREVPLALSFDPRAARSGMEGLASLAYRGPQNATLRLEGNTLVAVPALPGVSLDVENALASLAADPYGALFRGYLVLPMQPVAPRITDVSAVLAEAEGLLGAPPPIRAYDPVTDEHFDWPLSRETLASWMVIDEGADGPQIGLDAERLSAHLATLGDSLGPDRWLEVEGQGEALALSLSQGKFRPLIVRHRPTTYTVEPGDTLLRIGWKVGMPYWKLLEANSGLDEKALWVGQTITVPSKDELLPLPVVSDKRIVISISEQRMWTYQGGKLRSEYVISTGIDRSPTQPGIFQVRTHELEAYASVWDLYMPHFLGIYEAWPGFMNGIHGLPTLSSGVRLWANILGRPASYGCIILDLDDAEDLYNWAEEGVVVEIRA
jgi:lipoprotein-anchoring transpeptidase ErfK/SrfK